jgi:hypothetical protein
MDKPMGPWATLAAGIVVLGVGVVAILANPWARGGPGFIALGLILIAVAWSGFIRKARNAKKL